MRLKQRNSLSWHLVVATIQMLSLSSCSVSMAAAQAKDYAPSCVFEWSKRSAGASERTPGTRLEACVLREVQRAIGGLPRQPNTEIDRLRWLWSLGRPAGTKEAIVVAAYRERVVDPEQIVGYLQFVSFKVSQAGLVAAGALTLREPHASAPGTLHFKFGKRADYNGDGFEDVALQFSESWEDSAFSGLAVFSSIDGSLSIKPPRE